MATLDLMSLTRDPAVRMDSVTLDGDRLDYEGTAIKAIFEPYLELADEKTVFHNFTGWSNGYVKLQLKAGE